VHSGATLSHGIVTWIAHGKVSFVNEPGIGDGYTLRIDQNMPSVDFGSAS
jgi:hypothetical protein